MKKICFLFLIIVMIFCLISCGEKVILHCDGDGCNEEIEISYKKSEKKPTEEEWVVFCENCAKNLEE